MPAPAKKPSSGLEPETPSLPSGLECLKGLFESGLGLRYAGFVCHDCLESPGFED